MLQVNQTADKIIFIDKNGKAESIDLFDAIDASTAIRSIGNEQKAAQSASKAAVSLLASILNNPRLDGYKGKTPVNEAVPAELKAAIRELEIEYMKPVFTKHHADKGAKPATIEQQWQMFAQGLRAGGSYAVAKSEVTKYFAHCGQLPTADNGKLLTIAAIKKLLANAREAVPKKEDTGLAGKLVTLSSVVADSPDSDALGDYATAIAALKAMLAVYEEKYTESLETLTATIGNTEARAASVVSNMRRAPAPAKAPANVEPALM